MIIDCVLFDYMCWTDIWTGIRFVYRWMVLVAKKKKLNLFCWSLLFVSGECLCCLLMLLLIVWLIIELKFSSRTCLFYLALRREELKFKILKSQLRWLSEFCLLFWVLYNVDSLIDRRYIYFICFFKWW